MIYLLPLTFVPRGATVRQVLRKHYASVSLKLANILLCRFCQKLDFLETVNKAYANTLEAKNEGLKKSKLAWADPKRTQICLKRRL